jgi:large subunit ribosomal protein L24
MPAVPLSERTKVPDIRKGDTVIVLTGRDAGKRGVVDRLVRRDPSPRQPRSGYRRTSVRGGVYVVVDGINIAKRHTKPRQRSSAGGSIAGVPTVEPGGIIDLPQPMPASKVMLVCTHCDRPTRVAHQTLDSGRRVRVCRHCGEQVEVTK